MSQSNIQSQADRELEQLSAAFAAGDVLSIPSGLSAAHAACIDAAPDTELTLAISIGGSTTKLLLGRLGKRQISVIDALAVPNPSQSMPWQAFLIELITRSPLSVSYLRSAVHPRVGVSIAVPIQDGVPFHPSKMPTLEGLVSRSPTNDLETHHFGRNFRAMLESIGAASPRIDYRSDGVLAHLGAFFLSDRTIEDNTMLLVCGTGLACATRDQFILCGMARILPDDDPLTAHDLTEGGQYQHLIAGKGLWAMMRRSLKQAANIHRMRGLDTYADSFNSAVDSIRVRNLAFTDDTPTPDSEHNAIIRRIALEVFERGVAALANCALASAAHVFGQDQTVDLFLEGSIALDPIILQRLENRLTHVGHRYPTLRIAKRNSSPPPVDVTLVGAAVLGRLLEH